MGGQLAALAWEWLIDNSGQSEGEVSLPLGRNAISKIERDLSPGDIAQTNGLSESGLASCL